MVRPEKIELVEKVTQKLRDSQAVILADYKGMTVAQMTDLRTQMRQEAVEVRVIKNRLFKRALSQAGCDSLDDMLVGNTVISFGYRDPVAPAKILARIAKGNDRLVIKGGLLEGKRLDVGGVEDLSRMPGRKELLAQMAGDFKQPAAKVAMVFQAGLLKVAYAMQALARKKEEAGEAAA